MAEPDFRKVLDMVRDGNLDAARQVLVPYLKANPDSEYGWLMLSYALEEPEQQIECLERALKINPDNAPARQRLMELKTARARPEGVTQKAPAAPPTAAKQPVHTSAEPLEGPSEVADLRPVPEAQPTEGRSRIERLVILGLVSLFACVLVFGVYSAFTFFQNSAAAPEVPPTLSAPRPTQVPRTAVSGVDLPPTWTSTATPRITATPTLLPSRTPTVTQTLPSPDETQAAQMETIEEEVADLRGLASQDEVPKFILNRFRVREVLENNFLDNGGSREEIDDEARALAAVGLIKPTYDLFTNTLNGISDSIGGFYFPWSKEIYVIGSGFNGVERWVYSHEYGHALVDQYYNIGDMGVYPVCESNQDQCSAIQALVEGDATLLMTQWWVQYASPQDYDDILRYNPPYSTLPEQFPPPFAELDSNFPYIEGLTFAEFLYNRGNWAEVNRAFERLPESTEQILHPSKYLAQDTPIEVDLVEIDALLGGDWRLLTEDRLGEWTTFLLLGYGADLAAQIPDNQARSAAEGWGGDAYHVYFNDVTGESTLVAIWAWDSSGDASQFRTALSDHMGERFRGQTLSRPTGTCWQSNDQVSCIYTSGSRVLWILTPDEAVQSLILADYSGYQ